MFSGNEINDKYGYGTTDIPPYMQLNNYQSNNLEQYKKDLKYKLAKNSGLKKWDCYLEEKIFDKIEEINKIKEKFNYDKRIMGKEIFKNHRLPIIL
ncbi:hypothetical protein PVNG_05663 [Plasmodium vivax North Korean]|uniref:Uncharacterized protein n=1 Tax=Plasmodium vivax North Korean TaxID=1035514 RepID=A0A0J9TUD8_PLAVI|nr:hypothetical protein PVNG_06143 [Plasmodium vivax North Korean]KMZ98951.1 hypothetical protein PVNG_05663 [Plasmodium vivax North Korean]